MPQTGVRAFVVQVVLLGYCCACRPQEIDEAARRRLSKRLYIPLPDVQSRLQIMRNLLVQQRSDLTDEELQGLCEKTEGNSRDICGNRTELSLIV